MLFNRDIASRYGVSMGFTRVILKLLTSGSEITDYRLHWRSDDELDVKFKISRKSKKICTDFKKFVFPQLLGTMFHYLYFANLIPQKMGGEIQRKNGRRFYSIKSDVEPNVLPAERIAKVHGLIQERSLTCWS